MGAGRGTGSGAKDECKARAQNATSPRRRLPQPDLLRPGAGGLRIIDADKDGSDVFFKTAASLVGQTPLSTSTTRA